MAKQHVFSYGAGKAEAKGSDLTKSVLGGKGIGLMEMTSIGITVPAGFTISIQTCEEYYKLGRKLPSTLEKEVRNAVLKLEKVTGKKLGDDKDPLLVSVRSGAARSMPGMLETILNLGLNDKSVEGLAAKTGNARFAYDAYRRFIQMYSSTAMGLSKQPMEDMLHEMKHRIGVATDPEIPADKLKELCLQYKAFYKSNKGAEFPQDPWKQLWGAIMAVFNSWEAEKAQTYRRVEKITDLRGTAVNVVQMVFGNKGDKSGTGVCFTRDPNSGENTFYGDYLINAQGEDVVAAHASTAELRREIRRVRERTDRPFGVDVLFATIRASAETEQFTDAVKGWIDVTLEERVPVLIAGLGNPGPVTADAHRLGITVMALAGNVKQARDHAANGVDVVIAQGHEAGGHTGRIGGLVLIPSVVDAVAPRPVLAAGGIADGRGLVAALALGAAGIWIGTRFIATPEAYGHDNYKRKIVAIDEEGTVVSRGSSGKPCRLIRNNFTREWEGRAAEIQPFPIQFERVGKPAALRAREDGDIENGSAACGQSAALIQEIKPVHAVIDEIVAGAERVLSAITATSPSEERGAPRLRRGAAERPGGLGGPSRPPMSQR